jgi:hemolysin-activating ACP:hemolysin acyltransferase
MFFKSKTTTPKAGVDGAMKGNSEQAQTAATTTPPPLPATDASKLPKTAQRDGKAYSRGLIQAFGAIVAVCCRSRSHRGQTLAQIEELVTPAVLSGQFSLAEATHKENGLATPVAAILWASVSQKVDRLLSTGAPGKLQAADWKSGDIVWIVDAVGEKRMLELMVKSLREKAWKGHTVKVQARNAGGKLSVRILQSAAV